MRGHNTRRLARIVETLILTATAVLLIAGDAMAVFIAGNGTAEIYSHLANFIDPVDIQELNKSHSGNVQQGSDPLFVERNVAEWHSDQLTTSIDAGLGTLLYPRLVAVAPTGGMNATGSPSLGSNGGVKYNTSQLSYNSVIFWSLFNDGGKVFAFTNMLLTGHLAPGDRFTYGIVHAWYNGTLAYRFAASGQITAPGDFTVSTYDMGEEMYFFPNVVSTPHQQFTLELHIEKGDPSTDEVSPATAPDDSYFTIQELNVGGVPEPSTFMLSAIGMLFLAVWGRRRCRDSRRS